MEPHRKLPRAGKPAPLPAIGRMAMLDRVYPIERDAEGNDRLVEYADQAGRPFVFAFVDRDATTHRWLMFRVGRAALEAFRAGEISRHGLWERAEGEFDVVDLDERFRVTCLVTVPLGELLPAYVPSPGDFFRPDLEPTGWKRFQAEALDEAARRRAKGQVKAKLGPLCAGLLDALRTAAEGQGVAAFEGALCHAAESSAGPWTLRDVALGLQELHDRNLVHWLPPPQSCRPVMSLGDGPDWIGGSTGERYRCLYERLGPLWHWGKHPDAIARELHRRADGDA